MKCVVWLSGNWTNLSEENYPRFVALMRQLATYLPREIVVNVSGNAERIRTIAERLLVDATIPCPTCERPWHPPLRVGIPTCEVFANGPLDATDEATKSRWRALADLASWCVSATGRAPVIDFEGSLIVWFDGASGATLSLARLRENLEDFDALYEGPPPLVYPSFYAGFEARRAAWLATLLAAWHGHGELIGTTYHSPASLALPASALVRNVEAALRGSERAEQVIVGSQWWLPGTLATPLSAVAAADRTAWLWWQTDVLSTDPNVNLVSATMAATQAALQSSENVDGKS
ncbi:MAG: hypothetical protein AB1508_18985 [Pseudomonadota bacterium]